MSDRLAFHEERAAERDQRFTGWGRRKMNDWRAEVAQWHAGDRDALVREELKKNRWQLCGCGRPFQPGDKNYARCYTCSNASYAEGSTACVICQRRHSVSFACCKFCQTLGHEDLATLKRSLVLRRDGYVCAICGETEGVLDVHHILPAHSAHDWNLEVLCVADWVVLNASKAVGPLDELQALDRMLAYDSYLRDYLTLDERMMLTEQLHETLGSDMKARPPRDRAAENRGLVNVLNAFGRAGVSIE